MTTANLGMTKPTVGADADNWGTELNANLDLIDAAFDGGTWTPTDASGAGLSFTVVGARYRKIGPNLILLAASVTWPSTSNGLAAIIGGNPFTPATTLASITNSNAGVSTGAATLVRVGAGTNTIEVVNASTNGGVTNAQISTGFVRFCIPFFI